MLSHIGYKRQLEYFKTILNTVQAGINIIDENGIIVYVNDAYCQMNGYSKEELEGHSLQKILPDKDPKEGLKNYTKIINKKTNVSFIKEAYNTHKNGTKFPVLLSWNYLTEKEKVVGMVTVVQDLTKLKNAESALNKNLKALNELKATFKKREYLEYLMGDSPQIKAVHRAVERVAKTDFSILIYGETGVGKEIIAEAIHDFSKRENRPLVSVDCGAIPETLMESEFFGYVKGAFTGAFTTKDGAFQKANGGTIFLDEITNLPIEMQKKLLRVLQEHEVRKIGSTKKEKLNIRIIAASNENIMEMVKNGHFRKDLFFRLNEFMIEIPPLRNRIEDIPLLTQRFINEICSKLKCQKKEISAEAMDFLYNYDWPGNVRELKNVLKRAIVVSDNLIQPKHFDFMSLLAKSKISTEIKVDLEKSQSIDLKAIVKNYSIKVEEQIIKEVLEKFNGNKSKAARFLNIDYKTMLTKIKFYGVK